MRIKLLGGDLTLQITKPNHPQTISPISRYRDQYENKNVCMYASMLLHGHNMYTPAGFVNVCSSIGSDLSLISFAYIITS